MHTSQYSGLQKHSVGEYYPLTVRGRGHRLQAFDCLTAKYGRLYSWEYSPEESFGEAHDCAEFDMIFRLVFSDSEWAALDIKRGERGLTPWNHEA